MNTSDRWPHYQTNDHFSLVLISFSDMAVAAWTGFAHIWGDWISRPAKDCQQTIVFSPRQKGGTATHLLSRHINKLPESFQWLSSTAPTFIDFQNFIKHLSKLNDFPAACKRNGVNATPTPFQQSQEQTSHLADSFVLVLLGGHFFYLLPQSLQHKSQNPLASADASGPRVCFPSSSFS